MPCHLTMRPNTLVHVAGAMFAWLGWRVARAGLLAGLDDGHVLRGISARAKSRLLLAVHLALLPGSGHTEAPNYPVQ